MDSINSGTHNYHYDIIISNLTTDWNAKVCQDCKKLRPLKGNVRSSNFKVLKIPFWLCLYCAVSTERMRLKVGLQSSVYTLQESWYLTMETSLSTICVGAHMLLFIFQRHYFFIFRFLFPPALHLWRSRSPTNQNKKTCCQGYNCMHSTLIVMKVSNSQVGMLLMLSATLQLKL